MRKFQLKKLKFQKNEFVKIILKRVLRAAIAVVLAFVVTTVASQRIVKIAKRIEEQRIAAFVLERRNDTMATLQQGFKVVGENDKKILATYPTVDNIPAFVDTLESIANANSLQQTLRFGSPSLQTGLGLPLSTIDYDITLTGNSATLVNYLKSFSKLRYSTAINSISFTSQSSLGWNGDSSITLKATVYTREETNP